MISFLELKQRFLNNHDLSDNAISILHNATKAQKIFHAVAESSPESTAFRDQIKEKGRELVVLSQMDFNVIMSPTEEAVFKEIERITGLTFNRILCFYPNKFEEALKQKRDL